MIITPVIKHQVFWFDITMQNAILVQIFKSYYNTCGEKF